jgi:amidase
MSVPGIFNGIVESLKVEGRTDGPLSGLTFVVKDNFDVAGYRTGAGVPDWKRTHDEAAATAPAVSALLDAGAALIGKSCMDELAFSLDGINVHYGIPENHNYPGRIPGGSSSGSASAVAAGLCDLALGTDTAGSVRVPGAFCGVYSMRPTHGRISTNGVVPLGPSFDTVGWFAGSGSLLARCGEVLLKEAAVDLELPAIRLVGSCLDLLEPSLRKPFIEAAQGILPGINPDDAAELPLHLLEHWVDLLDKIRSYEAWQHFGKWIEEVNPEMQDVIKIRILNCRKVNKVMCAQAEAKRVKAISFLRNLLEEQTLCIPAVFNWPLACDSSEEERAAHRKKNLLLNVIAGVGGLPQVNVPVRLPGHSQRFGLSFVAKAGADCALLALARRLASA